MNPVLIWHWVAKMGAPILAAFLVGQYVAGRNCSEGKLREEIAALEAVAKAREGLLQSSEQRRLESQAALSKALGAYQAAVANEVAHDPRFGECRAMPMPAGLRLVLDPPDDPATH